MKAVWRRHRTLSRTVEAEAIIDEVGDLLSLFGLEPSRPREEYWNGGQSPG
jgi:hypothetical protein